MDGMSENEGIGSGSLTFTSTDWAAEGHSLKIQGDSANWLRWPKARVADMRHLYELPETYGELENDDVEAWYGWGTTVRHHDGWTAIETSLTVIVMKSDQVIGAPVDPYIERYGTDGPTPSTPV